MNGSCCEDLICYVCFWFFQSIHMLAFHCHSCMFRRDSLYNLFIMCADLGACMANSSDLNGNIYWIRLRLVGIQERIITLNWISEYHVYEEHEKYMYMCVYRFASICFASPLTIKCAPMKIFCWSVNIRNRNVATQFYWSKHISWGITRRECTNSLPLLWFFTYVKWNKWMSENDNFQIEFNRIETNWLGCTRKLFEHFLAFHVILCWIHKFIAICTLIVNASICSANEVLFQTHRELNTIKCSAWLFHWNNRYRIRFPPTLFAALCYSLA